MLCNAFAAAAAAEAMVVKPSFSHSTTKPYRARTKIEVRKKPKTGERIFHMTVTCLLRVNYVVPRSMEFFPLVHSGVCEWEWVCVDHNSWYSTCSRHSYLSYMKREEEQEKEWEEGAIASKRVWKKERCHIDSHHTATEQKRPNKTHNETIFIHDEKMNI